MKTETQTPSATLYYREGSSDKIYQCAVQPSGPGYIVTFTYGRRGSTLQTGTKTSKPVGFDEAKKIFDKLVREKTAKGYRSAGGRRSPTPKAAKRSAKKTRTPATSVKIAGSNALPVNGHFTCLACFVATS